MKKLLIVILICALTSFLFVGCFVTPEEEEAEPIVTIVCEGGYYVSYSMPWATTDCENPFPAGTYYYGGDGKVFLMGDVVWPLLATDVYGACPTGYVEEIFP